MRQPTERWAAWFQKVAAKEGVVTLDMGPNWNPEAGGIAESQAQQFKKIAKPRRRCYVFTLSSSIAWSGVCRYVMESLLYVIADPTRRAIHWIAFELIKQEKGTP